MTISPRLVAAASHSAWVVTYVPPCDSHVPFDRKTYCPSAMSTAQSSRSRSLDAGIYLLPRFKAEREGEEADARVTGLVGDNSSERERLLFFMSDSASLWLVP